MDPLSVLKTLWNYKWVSIPMVVLTVLACAYGLLWAPRSYESSATFALAMPSLPTEKELENEPGIAALNSDNPYLRWNDTSLLAQVVIARVSSNDVAESLEDRSLSTDFTLMAPAGTTSGMMTVTATDSSPEGATDTVTVLADEFTQILREVQRVNDADDLYLIQAMPISGPSPAEEVFSSRLRFTAILGVGGLVLLFGAVSLAQSISESRRRGRASAAHVAAVGTAAVVPASAEAEDAAGATGNSRLEPRVTGGGRRRHAEEAEAIDPVAVKDSSPMVDDRGLPQPQHAGR